MAQHFNPIQATQGGLTGQQLDQYMQTKTGPGGGSQTASYLGPQTWGGQDPSLVPGGPQDQAIGPSTQTPTAGPAGPVNAPQGPIAQDLEATNVGFGNPGGQAAADPYADPSGPVYNQFNRLPTEGTSVGQGFQAQGQYGTAMGVPGSNVGDTGDINAAPQASAAQIPPQTPPEAGPQQPKGDKVWQGGPGLYGGLQNALNQQQRQQVNQMVQQDMGLQAMAKGGQQSNVGRRQAMWSVLNQDNIYQNAPTDWGNFGGENWSGYGG